MCVCVCVCVHPVGIFEELPFCLFSIGRVSSGNDQLFLDFLQFWKRLSRRQCHCVVEISQFRHTLLIIPHSQYT